MSSLMVLSSKHLLVKLICIVVSHHAA